MSRKRGAYCRIYSGRKRNFESRLDRQGRDRRAHVEALWTNLDCRAVGRNVPEFLNLFIGECDATGSPILPTVKDANPTLSVLNSVYHDVRTGLYSTRSCTIVVLMR